MLDKHETLARRLAGILVELNTFGEVNIDDLEDRFDVSKRTLQKDLNDRLAFLDWEQCGPKIYRLNRVQFGVFTQEDIDRFANFASVQELFPKVDKEFFQKSLTESIKVQGVQYEPVQHRKNEFNQLRQAIENHQIIHFTYQKPKEPASDRTLEPYVLLNKNGVWYLIGLENGKEKTFCFSQISFIRVSQERFEVDSYFLQEIKQSDSISHGNQLPEVVIKVSAESARYFKRRALLPNQEIIREIDNGELLISCKNIHEMEIMPIVQYWIPNLTIVSPNELQEKLLSKLKDYLTTNLN